MKIMLKRTSPNYRTAFSTKRIMLELTLALLAVVGFVLYYYFGISQEHGMKAVEIIGVSCLVAIVTELIWFTVKDKSIVKAFNSVKVSFPLVTALIYALILPIGTPLYVVGVGVVVAIVFGKLIYGGFGQNIFNPAIVGRAVVGLSFGGSLVTSLPGDVVTGATPTTVMSMGNWVLGGESAFSYGVNELFLGMYSAALGETCTYLILGIGVIMAIRKIIDWKVPVVYMGTVAVLAATIAIFHGMNPFEYALIHIGLGGLAFGAVFMATDPVTNPTSVDGRIIFAIMLGFLTVLIRTKTNYPEGVYYAILLMNMVTPLIDRFTLGMTNKNLNKKRIAIGSVLAVSMVIIGSIGAVHLKPIISSPEVATVTHNGGVVSGKVKLSGTVSVTDQDGKLLGEQVLENAGSFDVSVGNLNVGQTILVTLTTENGQTSLASEVKVAQGIVAEIIGVERGSYIVKTSGFYDNLILRIAVDTDNKAITRVFVVHSEETEEYGGYLFDGRMAPEFHQTVMNGVTALDAIDDIDVKTGATKTAEGVVYAMQAVADELNKDIEVVSISGNVVTLNVKNSWGSMVLEVTVRNGTISTNVVVNDQSDGYGIDLLKGDTPSRGNKEIADNFFAKFITGPTAIEELSNVDLTTGATVTAESVRDAVYRAVVER